METRKARGVRHDYAAARMLYATGSSFADIAAATGIPLGSVGAEASRKNWAKDREKVQMLAKRREEETQIATISLKEKAEQWPSRVAEIANKGLKVLELETPGTLSEVDRLVGVLDKVDKVARRSMGLDEEAAKGGNTIVNLGFLSGYQDDPLRAEIVPVSEPLLHE